MSYRDASGARSPTRLAADNSTCGFDSFHDDGPESPPLPKFDYNNDRIQNDLLQEICSDIGIKDAMDLDFFDFDDFEEKKYNMNEEEACLDQVIPFGELQQHEDSFKGQFMLANSGVARVKDEMEAGALASGMATGVPSPMASPIMHTSVHAESHRPHSNSSEPITERITESPLEIQPKSEPPMYVNSPCSKHLVGRSQSVDSPIGSPAIVPSVGSPRRSATPRSTDSPIPFSPAVTSEKSGHRDNCSPLTVGGGDIQTDASLDRRTPVPTGVDIQTAASLGRRTPVPTGGDIQTSASLGRRTPVPTGGDIQTAASLGRRTPVPTSDLTATSTSHTLSAGPVKTESHTQLPPVVKVAQTVSSYTSQPPPSNNHMSGVQTSQYAARPLSVRTGMHQYRMGQPQNLDSPHDHGYYSVGSSSVYTASHYGSTSEMSAGPRSVSPADLEQQSVSDKVQNYLNQSIPEHNAGYYNQRLMMSKVPVGSMSMPQHSAMGPQYAASTPLHHPPRVEQPLSSDRSMVPAHQTGVPGHMPGPRFPGPGQPSLGQHPQSGYRPTQSSHSMYVHRPPVTPTYPQQPDQFSQSHGVPPSAYHAQRSGSQPTSPKKRRQEMEGSYMPQGYMNTQSTVLPPMGSSGTPNIRGCMGGQFTPQTPRNQMQPIPEGPTQSYTPGVPMRQTFAGQPIKNEYIQRQQVKRTTSYRERISPEKPPDIPGQVPGETIRPGITKIPPVTAQHGFIHQLINDRTSAFRSHPLFPLLRDLIIADMNFYSPAFPFALIANLPQDFERLLSNYQLRNPASSNRRNNQSIENVVTDALRYAHRALIGKLAFYYQGTNW